MRVWTPAFQHQFLDGNLLNFNAPPGAAPIISFEAPVTRPTPAAEARGFPVRRGNRFTYQFAPGAFPAVIGADVRLEIALPANAVDAQLLGEVVLGSDVIRLPLGFVAGNARIQWRVVDNANVMATSTPFDPAVPLHIRARWHTHGPAYIWVNGALRSYRPALGRGQVLSIDRVAFGHHDVSGFAPDAPSFLLRRVTVKLLREDDAARFVDGLVGLGEPPAVGDDCRRKLSAVDAEAARAMRQFMSAAVGKLTTAWEAPQAGGPFSPEGLAAHAAATAAGRAFVAFLLGRPGGDAAIVSTQAGRFLALLRDADPDGYAQAVSSLQQISSRYDPACLAELAPFAQQHAASLQPIAALLMDVWTKIQSPGAPNE